MGAATAMRSFRVVMLWLLAFWLLLIVLVGRYVIDTVRAVNF